VITAESSEVKELFLKSREISCHFDLKGEKLVIVLKKKDICILSALKSPPSCCFVLMVQVPAWGCFKPAKASQVLVTLSFCGVTLWKF